MSQKILLCLYWLCCFYLKALAQSEYSINLYNKDNQPVRQAFAITDDTVVFSNVYGQIKFDIKPKNINIYAEGFLPIKLSDYTYQVFLKNNSKPLSSADDIMQKAFELSDKNNIYRNFKTINFSRYNRTLIKRDSTNFSSTNENLFSERISNYTISDAEEKELIIAQKNQGFSKPVLKILSHRMHSINWYSKTYVIFETDYFSPLHPDNKIAYNYTLILEDDNFYYIKYTPALSSTEKLLEGILRFDKNFALSKIYANKNDQIKLDLYQNFSRNNLNNIWQTSDILVEMTPGKGGKPVSIFGANVNIGTLQEKSVGQSDLNNRLYSRSLFFDYQFSEEVFDYQKYNVFVDIDAHEKDSLFWEINRKIKLTSEDSIFFKGTAKTLNQKNTINKIKRLENVNKGFFPILKWKTDLKTLIKVNNYEGFRLGIGGLTNEEFSESFRVGGYLAYGTKDKTVKFGMNTGLLIDRDSNMWLNASYADDVREVGSNAYLTDERVYSLFEPRLVNIIFFYKEKTTSLSLQKRISPTILSEFKVAYDRIFQTENYAFINGNIALQSYDLTRALLSLRWSPKSKFLKFDNNFVNIKENYPVVSGQVEQYFGNTFGGDLAFTKINLKSEYIINHINNHVTEFSLEGNLAIGDVPLTHSFHAFPNAPNKSTILDRFSVAGVKSFETMFFSEFFSTRLASLHIKHRLAPFKITNKIQPEMVFISRHAVGNFTNPERHLGINFNTLEYGYSEAGLELNKIFWGFGLSFAYRYGGYHLPNFEDNIALKFTFNLKL